MLSRLKIKTTFLYIYTTFKNRIFKLINCFRLANVMNNTMIINIFTTDNSNIAYINT